MPPWIKRIFFCTPILFVFWKNGGKYPARPTAKIPFEGPATHVKTPASTPNAKAMAITGESHEARMKSKYQSKPTKRLCVKLISLFGMMMPSEKVPKTKIKTVMNEPINTALG